jgi:hypothetical protein
MLPWSLFRYLRAQGENDRSGSVSLLSREKAGEAFRMVNALPLDAPLVAWGRIVDSIWLRLSRDHAELCALLSKDGLTWMNA